MLIRTETEGPERAADSVRPAPRRFSNVIRRTIASATILVGLALLVGAIAQPLKARLGQSLLAEQFAARMAATPEEQADASRWRPWPWADLAPIAELRFPELDERRIVVDSASGEALAWAVGHVPGTAELGSPGISAIAGHRDGRFELLDRVHEGDSVALTTLDGQTARYVVEERLVVDSRNIRLPIVHTGPNELILTTCWPIDALFSGPDRLLVRARLTG